MTSLLRPRSAASRPPLDPTTRIRVTALPDGRLTVWTPRGLSTVSLIEPTPRTITLGDDGTR